LKLSSEIMEIKWFYYNKTHLTSSFGIGLRSLQRKIYRARRLSGSEKLAFLSAWILLGLTRAVILTIPFRHIAPWLGHGLGTAAVMPLATSWQVARAMRIGYAVRAAARHTPWESKCLAQAMTARALLGLCRLPYALYLGVRVRASGTGTAGIEAHAWVCTGPATITGGHSFRRFTVVGTFVSSELKLSTTR